MGATTSAELEFLPLARALEAGPVLDRSLWERMWKLDPTPENVWRLFNLERLQSIRNSCPFNFAAIIVQCLNCLSNAVFSPESEIPAAQHNQILLAVRILTRCMALISSSPGDPFDEQFMWNFKLPPQPINGDIESSSVSTTSKSSTSASSSSAGQLSPVSASQEQLEKELTGSVQPSATTAPPTEEELLWRLRDMYQGPGSRISKLVPGAQVIKLLTACLFLKGFTIGAIESETLQELEERARAEGKLTTSVRNPGGPVSLNAKVPLACNLGHVNVLKVWFAGAGPASLTHPARSPIYDTNRVAIIVCLLAACSGGAYVPATHFRGTRNRYLDEMVSRNHTMAPTLFFSLLNAIVTFDPVGQIMGYVPYGHNLTLYSDTREALCDVSLHLMLVMLDHMPLPSTAPSEATPEAHESESKSASGGDSSATATSPHSAQPNGSESASQSDKLLLAARNLAATLPLPSNLTADNDPNVIRGILRILTQEDLTIVALGIAELLANPIRAESTWLPNSVKRIECHQELLVLLWHFIDISPNFIHVLVQDASRCIAVLRPLLVFTFQTRGRPMKMGLLYTCIFLLMRLSSIRSFAVALNTPFPNDFYLGPDAPDLSNMTYADVLILVCHRFIHTAPPELESLLAVVLNILVNISPYCMRLSLATAARIHSLFEIFASDAALFKGEVNHRYVDLLLEFYANILQYQFPGNAPLAYVLASRPRVFAQLRDFVPRVNERFAAWQQSRMQANVDPSGRSQVQQLEQMQSRSRSSSQAPAPQPHAAAVSQKPSTSTQATASGPAEVTSSDVHVAALKEAAQAQPAEVNESDSHDVKSQPSAQVTTVHSHPSDPSSSTDRLPQATKVRGETRDTDASLATSQPSAASTAAAEEVETEEKQDPAKDSSLAKAESPKDSNQAESETKDGHELKANDQQSQQGAQNHENGGQVDATSPQAPTRLVPAPIVWSRCWRSREMLMTILHMLDFVVPLIRSTDGNLPADEAVQKIAAQTLVGLLPVPHPIVVRAYVPNHITPLWFAAFVWGIISVRAQPNQDIFYESRVLLFSRTRSVQNR